MRQALRFSVRFVVDFLSVLWSIFCPFCGRFSVDFTWIFVRFLSIFWRWFRVHWPLVLRNIGSHFLVACLGQLGVHWTADFLGQVLRVSLRSISDLTRRPVENRPEPDDDREAVARRVSGAIRTLGADVKGRNRSRLDDREAVESRGRFAGL